MILRRRIFGLTIFLFNLLNIYSVLEMRRYKWRIMRFGTSILSFKIRDILIRKIICSLIFSRKMRKAAVLIFNLIFRSWILIRWIQLLILFLIPIYLCVMIYIWRKLLVISLKDGKSWLRLFLDHQVNY